MGMRRKRCRGFEGSYTIELSLLIPFILFLIWNLLFLSFFLYDQSTALQGSYTTALRTERLLGAVGDKQSEAEKKYELVVSGKMACGEATPDIEATEKDVRVGTKVSMNAPGVPFYDSLWSGEHIMKADEWKPVKYIRMIRKGEKLITKGK